MIIPTLFYSEENKEYYWVADNKCSKCSAPLSRIGWLLWDYYTHHFKELVYCFKCKEIVEKEGGKYKEVKPVTIISQHDLPFDAVMIFPTKPQLSNSKAESVFEVATRKEKGVTVVNKCIASHDPNFMIDSSAKDPELLAQKIKEERALLESQNNKKSVAIDKVENVSEDEFDSLLDSFKNSEAVLDYDEKKQLEDKRDE